MHVIQISATTWLVLDEVTHPRWAITRSPLVHKQTGETHVMDTVALWNFDAKKRVPLSVHDGLERAKAWCAEQLAAQARERANKPAIDPATGRPLRPKLG